MTTNDGDPSITSLTNVFHQRLLDEVSVDAETPSQIQSVGREEGRGSVDGILEGGARNSTKTSQSVSGRGASRVLHQVVVGGLVFIAVSLVYGRSITRLL